MRRRTPCSSSAWIRGGDFRAQPIDSGIVTRKRAGGSARRARKRLLPMQPYPAPAAKLVDEMVAAAAAAPERTVAFQGAPGANSHIAVGEAFPDALPLPCFGFEDAIDAVREGLAGRALIPIENSLHGRVADMHFLLPESGLVIVGEHFLPIRHCLLGSGTIDDVDEAMSHPQALGQCRHWLRGHGIRAIPFPDTAAAAAA